MHKLMLRVLQAVGGLPVDVADSSVIILGSGLRIIVATLVWMFFSSIAVPYIVYTQSVGLFSYSDFVNGVVSAGHTVTDVVCIFGYSFCNMLVALSILTWFVVRRKKINALAVALETPDISEAARELRRREAIVIAVFLVANFTATSLLFRSFWTFAGVRTDLPFYHQLIMSVFYSVALFTIVFSPLVAGVHFFLITMVQLLVENIKHWVEHMSLTTSRSKLDLLVEEGDRLLHLLRDYNSVVGVIAFLEISKLLINSIAMMLFVSSFHSALASENAYSDASFVVTGIVYLSMAMFSLKKWVNAGQNVLDLLEFGRLKCQRHRVDNSDSLDAKAKLRLENLTTNLGRCAGITPASSFVLGNNSMLSAFGLLVTYFVVLFQFKIEK